MTVGRLAIVLHSHSPWLVGYGTWPVGEEWLRQAWAHSYLPVLALLRARAEQGRTDMLTLGVTPVLAAQWDEPSTVREQARWIEDWRLRASGKAIEAIARADDHALTDATRHFRLAGSAAHEFETHWRAGGSAALRPLVDARAIEVLGGPMTHTFTPHLLDPVAHLAFASGLTDSTVRLGHQPRGVWIPECAYRPGVEGVLQHLGVSHTMVDGPSLQRIDADLHRPHRISGSDVVVFGRDLSLTYRVWSPRRGYPGSPWYQDFHTFDHDWGLRSFRVTRRESSDKAPYSEERAREQVLTDAQDFLATARQTLVQSKQPDPVVVVGYDTELFGHWWHEGPQFLAAVLDGASDAGIQLTTLAAERERMLDSPAVELQPGSWGSGKDFRVWENGEAGDLRDQGRGAQYAFLEYLRSRGQAANIGRDVRGDAIATELLLGLASDWPFMITKDSAAEYARNRADTHLRTVADLLRSAHHNDSAPARDTRLPFVDSRVALQGAPASS